MRQVIALTLAGLLCASAEAACPVGSHPWVDSWGNSICKRFSGGATTTIEGSLERCPVGTTPWVDSWGNRICRSLDRRESYYDTSRGCPVGTYQWVDEYGNAVCKRF